VIDGIDQQAALDLEFPAVHGRRGAYFGIHTRTRDSSFSTSSGLAI
jgi:hypothetical protein